MPERSLEFATSFFADCLPPPPWIGLHIGNFVGISLAYLVRTILDAHPASVMVSIDPDIPHRGIAHPSRLVIALLNEFGLQEATSILTGYSLEKNLSNDGFNYGVADYDPIQHYQTEISLHNQLPLLNALAPGAFHFAVVDGNHDPSYLEREVRVISSLLRPGGVLFVDDVNASWPELRSVYQRLSQGRLVNVGTDGRVGVLRVPAAK